MSVEFLYQQRTTKDIREPYRLEVVGLKHIFIEWEPPHAGAAFVLSETVL